MQWTNAAFMRGGTSKGLFFAEQDLPPRGPDRDALYLRALGSPDRFGRQIDGMGGGISSLSKVVSVTASDRAGAELDYTVGQVAVDAPVVDYSGNCGNLSAAVVPFALESGLLVLPDGPQTVRIFNTNTEKHIEVQLRVENGTASASGPLVLPGVSGTGSPIELRYLRPAGSRTGALLPTGAAADVLRLEDGEHHASLIDAANPMVFVRAEDLGLRGDELPAELDADSALMGRLDRLRRAGAVAMGMAAEDAAAPRAVPKIALVAGPRTCRLLDGTTVAAEDADLTLRVLSMEQTHLATPGTAALCTAAAAQIPGSTVAEAARPSAAGGALRIATPSGVVTAGADVRTAPDGRLTAESASLYRTARTLMRGQVAVPAGQPRGSRRGPQDSTRSARVRDGAGRRR
ncbi:PrpF domain-containing protein [Brevibacterium salitolerans]|uniref:2-methylaconitate cis-trans isomerase PrpF n=1 Tax=Brevibacterium salitolerans TaxID=1403566 RepID=A0ABN2WYI0_9MICO